ncbi:putative cytochrome P450 [Nemania sp. FL0916]|nr:putative cytochrome P450 [Nemania sp. FL0916]
MQTMMHLAQSLHFSFSLLYLVLIPTLLFLCIYYTKRYLRLSHIPGPLLARLSNIPRLYSVYHRNAHDDHISLHRHYGKDRTVQWAPLVVYGPNAVSVGSAEEIETIYRLRGNPLMKSDFYSVIPPMRKGVILPTIFATQDESIHRMLKRPIASVYSMSNLVSFEPLVDSTIEVFQQELDRRFAVPQEICDFGTWLQYFAFDVIGEITFSKRLGFLEEGRDVDGIMASIWHWFEYVAVIGQMPWLDLLWVKNKFVSRLRPAKWSPMVQFAHKCEQERRSSLSSTFEEKNEQLNSRDFLSRFLAASQKDPSIPSWALSAWTSSNIIAGSDTTAIFLRTMFYELLIHPDSLAKLREELDTASARGEISQITTWKESSALPYLNACFKEAGRIHPPFGLHLERVVPPEGLEVCGTQLPAGTIVGMNAWVVHRDPEVFGSDADAWRPERWLDGDQEQLKKMNASLLTFGAGHRVCLGKHISYLEIFKLVPTLLQAYDIELAEGGRACKIQNRWFVVQSGFNVRLHPRKRHPVVNA